MTTNNIRSCFIRRHIRTFPGSKGWTFRGSIQRTGIPVNMINKNRVTAGTALSTSIIQSSCDTLHNAGTCEAHPVSISPTAACPVNITTCDDSCDAAARHAYLILKRVSCVACNPALNSACHRGIFKVDFIVIRIAGSLIVATRDITFDKEIPGAGIGHRNLVTVRVSLPLLTHNASGNKTADLKA